MIYTYKQEEFKGYTHRAKFAFIKKGEELFSNIDVYTDNPNKEEVKNKVEELLTYKDYIIDCPSCGMVHWCTKEQDDKATDLINETLKDL